MAFRVSAAVAVQPRFSSSRTFRGRKHSRISPTRKMPMQMKPLVMAGRPGIKEARMRATTVPPIIQVGR